MLCVLASSAAAEDLDHGKYLHTTLKSASELDYPPFAVVREDGSANGFSVDLLKAVAAAMNIPVDFSVGPWHEIKNQLTNGQIDVLPFVSYSEDRNRVFDFSASYMRLHGTIFVRDNEVSIQSEADLKQKQVIVMRGDNAHEYAVKNHLTDTLILTDTYEQALQLLSSGRHDAVLMLQLVGTQLLKKLDIQNVVSIHSFKETNLRPVGKPLSGYEQKFSFAVTEGNKELLALLNEGLAIVIANGQYNELYDKWFSPILPLPKPGWKELVKALTFIVMPILFLAAIIGLWIMKKEIARKTKHLRQEVQDRNLAEQTLQKSESKFRMLFHSAAIPMCFVKDDGSILDINSKLTQVFGYTLADIPTLDHWWEKVYPDPKYRQWVRSTWADAVTRAKTFHIDIDPVEYQMTCKNNEIRNVIISGTVLHDHFLATFVDLTERLNMEASLKQTLADLEKSNAALQQFAYVASHDLQEPLRAVVGFLQLLESRFTNHLDEKAKHYIERAVNAGTRMQSLINDLLRLSRVNTQELVLKATDLHRVVNDIAETLTSAFQEKQIQVTVSSDLPMVIVDRIQITSLFQNLMTNAVKYNENCPAVIEIGCRDTADEYIFHVKDNGIGIDPQFHERIFMIFQRLHTRQEYSGTGIGLALCQKIIDRHHGRIWLESSQNEGTTFFFTLPKQRKTK